MKMGDVMRSLSASLLCLVLAGCATVEQAPNARPLSQANIEALGPTPLSVLAEANRGMS